MKVGIVGYLFTRGLGYDVEAVRDALAGAPGVETSVFPVRDLYRVDRILRENGRLSPVRPAKGWDAPDVEHRLDLLDWVATLDAVVTLEVFLRGLTRAARERGVRTVHVPNLEWVSDREGFLEELASVDALVAKTHHTAAAFRGWGLGNVREIPWSIPLAPEPPRPAGDAVKFLHLCGVGSRLEAKNPEAVLTAFADCLGGRDDARLTVHAQLPFRKRKVPLYVRAWRAMDNVTLLEGERSREEVLGLFGAADAAVLPSRTEGFGLTHLEALTLGVPVVTTDAPPMNELVLDGENGLLVPGTVTGRHRHVDAVEVDRTALGSAMARLVDDRELLARLKAGTHAGLADRSAAFRSGIRSAVGAET